MKKNKGTAHEKVFGMSKKSLQAEMVRIAGYDAPFTDSWDAVIGFWVESGLLRHTKYLYRTQKGRWIVRERAVAEPISSHQSGPIAVCQAIAIVVNGKGSYYSPHYNEDQSKIVHDSDYGSF